MTTPSRHATSPRTRHRPAAVFCIDATQQVSPRVLPSPSSAIRSRQRRALTGLNDNKQGPVRGTVSRPAAPRHMCSCTSHQRRPSLLQSLSARQHFAERAITVHYSARPSQLLPSPHDSTSLHSLQPTLARRTLPAVTAQYSTVQHSTLHHTTPHHSTPEEHAISSLATTAGQLAWCPFLPPPPLLPRIRRPNAGHL